MPVFKDQENKTFKLLPPGDYVYRVKTFESGLQTGQGKTVGSPFWELHLEIEGHDCTVFERLIDHAVCDYKIDTFLKSSGVTVPKGTAFEFDQQAADASGAVHIDIIGLRGWCSLLVDEYQPAGKPEKQKRNKVACFYTNKPKLPRHVETPATAPEPDPLADPLGNGGPF